MDTKIVSEEGRAMLVVADPRVNAAFDCDASNPVRLMELSNCDIGSLKFPLYSLLDWRLTKHMSPNAFLSSSPNEWMEKVDSHQMAKILELVPVHRISGPDVIWSTFSGVVPGPHKVEDVINPNSSGVPDSRVISFIDGGREGRWTYEEGLKMLKEAQTVWLDASVKSWEDMNAMRLPNFHLQVSQQDVLCVLRAEEAKSVLSAADWKNILADKVKP